MRIRTPFAKSAKTFLFVLLTVGLLTPGCSRTEPDSQANLPAEPDEEYIQSAADLMASDKEPDVGSDSFAHSKTPPPETMGQRDDLAGDRTPAVGSTAPVPPQSPGGFELAESTSSSAGMIEMIGVAGAEAAQDARSLRDDMTTDQLIKYLEDSDRDMEMLARGRNQLEDPEQANELMQKLVKRKLEASTRLKSHTDATEKQRSTGLRGELQALSHLSAMGDISSAKALELLAKENLSSDEPTISGDSRIVLIGFAIDALQAGRDSAGEEIVTLIQGMTASPTPDVPAVLMMAEARQILASYGLVDESAKVRERILQLYGNSPDKMIAQIAADAAGTAIFDPASRLLGEILENKDVALARWTEVLLELTADSPDMNTVEFLGTSALQLEAAGQDAFVEETFRILAKQFTNADSATANEIETARLAMEARRDVIGTSFDAFADLPSVDGKGVSPDLHSGKIVLVPFWAIVFPSSLQIVPMLKEIQARHPEQISIVGMNLDPEQAPLREFLLQNDLGFPSYRSLSTADGNEANPVATKFGLVSLPFVAIFNRDGKVEALDFTGLQLNSIVERLVQPQN